MDDAPSRRPFRFLDLPAEMRLIVYEYLPLKTVRHKFDQEYHQSVSNRDENKIPSFTLINFLVPSEILATCRLIYREAGPIINRKIKRSACQSPDGTVLRLEANCYGLLELAKKKSVLDAISNWYEALEEDATSDFESVMQHNGFDFEALLYKTGYKIVGVTDLSYYGGRHVSEFVRRSGLAMLRYNNNVSRLAATTQHTQIDGLQRIDIVFGTEMVCSYLLAFDFMRHMWRIHKENTLIRLHFIKGIMGNSTHLTVPEKSWSLEMDCFTVDKIPMEEDFRLSEENTKLWFGSEWL